MTQVSRDFIDVNEIGREFPEYFVQGAIEYRAERAKRERANRKSRYVAEDGVASASELQRDYEAALYRERKLYGATMFTVEAVMYSLRERGVKALAETDCQRRLSELSGDQRREVVKRLLKLRRKYPAISNELIFRLSEKRP